jgi:hypothetical protein
MLKVLKRICSFGWLLLDDIVSRNHIMVLPFRWKFAKSLRRKINIKPIGDRWRKKVYSILLIFNIPTRTAFSDQNFKVQSFISIDRQKLISIGLYNFQLPKELLYDYPFILLLLFIKILTITDLNSSQNTGGGLKNSWCPDASSNDFGSETCDNKIEIIRQLNQLFQN